LPIVCNGDVVGIDRQSAAASVPQPLGSCEARAHPWHSRSISFALNLQAINFLDRKAEDPDLAEVANTRGISPKHGEQGAKSTQQK
jgi:hypothetical protein